MPGAVHLALGAVAGALAIGLGPASVTLAGLAVLLLGTAGQANRGHGKQSATTGGSGRLLGLRLVPLGLGLALLGARGLAASAPVPDVDLPEGRGPWVGVVESVSAPRAGSRPAVLRLETEADLRLAATLPWFPPVGPGDRVSVAGRAREPPEGPYGDYLARIGVAGTLNVDALELLPPNEGPARWLEDLRRAAADGLSLAIPEPQAGLAAGVLIGLRDRVDRTLAADFTTAGASHVVAISGWNIAIVASTLAAVAGSMQRRRRAALTAIAIVAYVAFVGPSASVVRAAAMAGIALLARELGRPGTAAAALGWAVTLLLLADPTWVDAAGFRLSALATAGIIAWGSSWTRRLAGDSPSRPRHWLAEILGVSLAAQVATLPIVLLDFGRLSIVAPLVNLVVVPLVPPAMAAGAVALGGGLLVLAGMPSIVATLAGLPAWALYGLIVAAVRAGAGMPFASLELTTPWDGAAAATAAALVVGAVRWGGRIRRSRRPPPGPGRATSATARHRSTKHGTRHEARHGSRSSGAIRLAAGALAIAIAGLGLAVAHRPDGFARIVALDVGQGDAILVEGGLGGRLLVDGGPDPGRLLIALDERFPPWDRRIDAVVLTHPHEDHVAGLVLVLQRYRVERVYEPGMAGPGPGYAAWEVELGEPGAPTRKALATGDRLAVDEVRLHVLWPDPGQVPEAPASTGTGINNVSIVLLGEFRGQRFLLTGDIEEEVDPELVARGLPRVDVLKVAHHGSRTASTEDFLEALRPRIAVVSTGRGNPYGHPTPEALDRLAAAAGRTYRTDLDGTVEVVLDGATARVTTAPARAPAVSVAAAVAEASRASPVPLPRPAAGSVEGRRSGPRYHRPDGERTALGDWLGAQGESRVGRAARRAGPARLPVGRRRLRPGGRGRGAPPRRVPLPRGPPGALAPGVRSRRPRPAPRGDSGAAGHRLDVRGRRARRPRRSRCARSSQPGS
ncbi:MAG: ComEC/Rec2 family competence protein [Chloroflexi bacterium]|nr:ComEC/Rec2 family competence protein [Chloroflexota bacterium]